MKVQEIAQGIILEVRVKPNSKEFRLITKDDELMVLCREAPKNGKVNKELLKKFSRLFGKKVDLVSGFSSKQKKILVNGITTKEAIRILASASNTQ